MSRGRDFGRPHVEGVVSRQAHVDLPAGTYERELGREGFFGPATHMYHQHPPTSWSAIDGPLRPRAFDTAKLLEGPASPWECPALLANASLRIRVWTCTQSMDHLARNADGDELLFVHSGAGALLCDYGHLAFRDGDYLLLPRGTAWRLEVDAPATLLMLESTGGRYALPERGPLGDHALFDPGVLDVPALDDAFAEQRDTPGPWTIRVKARGAVSTLRYPHNPLDAVGWKGTLSALRLNWRDIRPVTSPRYHLPPSAHTTFVAPRFVVCTFCPRPLETEQGALKVPFYHSNDDFDEVIFYHAGAFMSRDDVGPGMLSLHPSGFPHGPHPKAFRRSQHDPRSETDEVAVMIDARDPLAASDHAADVERPEYVDSWRDEPSADGSAS